MKYNSHIPGLITLLTFTVDMYNKVGTVLFILAMIESLRKTDSCGDGEKVQYLC